MTSDTRAKRLATWCAALCSSRYSSRILASQDSWSELMYEHNAKAAQRDRSSPTSAAFGWRVLRSVLCFQGTSERRLSQFHRHDNKTAPLNRSDPALIVRERSKFCLFEATNNSTTASVMPRQHIAIDAILPKLQASGSACVRLHLDIDSPQVSRTRAYCQGSTA